MSLRAVVLAAGKGTRMKSASPKVLHELCGRPMLWYVLAALRRANIDEIVVVMNTELDAQMQAFGVRGVMQGEQLGTGHALKVALDAMEPQSDGRILVACADMPLVGEALYGEVLAALEGDAALALVTVAMPLPSNFGRVIRNADGVQRIVEVRDASPTELALREMNAGIYAFDEGFARTAVAALRPNNAQGEYYLTDAVAHAVADGRRVAAIHCERYVDALGINDRSELARARSEMNARLCREHMLAGVTIIDPLTTYLEPELVIGRDTVIYPNTAISLLSSLGANCVVGPNARLSNATLHDHVTVRESVILDSEIGSYVTIGPFAHLRGKSVLGDGVHIGNFVEVKNTRLSAGVKAGHLTYLGDARIGERANIGAGTITCNFDGVAKHETQIGKDAFIGSNSSLVAPVRIGDSAMTGAGAVVTKDVAPGERVAGNPARALPAKSTPSVS